MSSLTHHSHTLKLGYVPLIDSAPLLVAQQEGYFEEEGVNVILSEEVGWATIRDKLIHGELSMASSLIGLPYALHNGIGCHKTEMSIPLILSANGNTLALSSEISQKEMSEPSLFAKALNKRASKGNRKWTFATVNPYSSHLMLLYKWLSQHLASYIHEIEIVFLPPQLFPELLSQGMIDGFCAGEPWGSIAEESGAGWVASTSKCLNVNHPEKALAVPKTTLKLHTESVKKVGNALLKACKKCEDLNYRDQLISLLSQSQSLEKKSHDITKILEQQLSVKNAENPPAHKFYDSSLNKPSADKEKWVISGLKEAGLFRKKIIATGQIMHPELLF